jgi:TRAP-type C4-dicarboxylate transport system permease small subunit
MTDIVERDRAPQALAWSGLGRLLDHAATVFAIGGGLVFCALVAMSIVSIVGRKLFAAPVQGDVELMQMGAAVGAAAFLPLCELHDHHIRIDALTGWMSDRARAGLDAAAHALLAGATVLLTWRTSLAVIDARASGEVSTLLAIPAWQPVVLLVPSLALLALCGLYRSACAAGVAMGRAS